MTELEIKRVAIIGAGNQGPRIAYRCVKANYDVALYSRSRSGLERGMGQLMGFLDEKLSSKEAAEARKRIVNHTISIEDCVRNADLIIETVPENVPLKRHVWAKIDAAAKEGALICTNSSSQPCSRFADVVKRPEKAFNVNFSDPAHDNLVEVMGGANTSQETLIRGVLFLQSLNMVPIVTFKEIMGFSYNRVWRAVKREALHLVDQGFVDFQDLDRAWMMDFGTECGPFGMMDMVGIDVVRDIEALYYEETGENSDKPPRLLDEMIAKGELGIKTGRGFYNYPNPAYKDPDWLKKQGVYVEDIREKLAAMKRKGSRQQQHLFPK